MRKLFFLLLCIWETLNAQEWPSMVCYNTVNLNIVKERIKYNDLYYKDAFDSLINEASQLLSFIPNPVVNKRLMPPSGDKHDYLSIAPYFWPNELTSDGMPWIPKDGVVNPMSRGDDTDFSRTSEMFDALDKLSLAYIFSCEKKYLIKAQEIVDVWFVSPETKMNPNTNYGQSVPGGIEGRPLGIIEWGIGSLITSIQLLKHEKISSDSFNRKVDEWLEKYLYWLLNSKLGKEEDAQPQNHGNWYDYKVLTLQLYLRHIKEAKEHISLISKKRIENQISLDGAQPYELRRTKSVYYSEMNLRAMTLIAELAKQVGIDLWNYRAPNGQSIDLAYDWLRPYVYGDKEWSWKQITPGGIPAAMDTRMKPLFSIGSTLKGEYLYEPNKGYHNTLNYIQRLKYPPLKDLINE